MHNRLSEYHPASAPADPAVLESFRPFLQQLAAGIVAGFSAARPKGTSQVTGGGDGIAASILQTTAAAPAATPSDSYSSWQPSELSAQHMIDHLMLMGEQRGSCGAWPPGSSDLPMRDAVDAVAVVSRRTRGREQRAGGKRAAQKCTVLRGTTEHRTTAAAATGEVRTVHKQKDQYKAGSCRTSSNVIPQLDPAPPTAAGAMEAEEPMTPPTADITAVSRLAAAAPDSTAAADTTSSADMNAYAQESYLHQEPLGRYLVPLVLISSCQRAQPEQRKVSYSLGSWPTGADAANHLAGNSAIQVAAIAPAAAATAAVASTSTKPLTSCRASTSMGTSPELKRGAAASADSNSDSLMTNAAARRINSIRQHVALLEATLGKQSTQVGTEPQGICHVCSIVADSSSMYCTHALRSGSAWCIWWACLVAEDRLVYARSGLVSDPP